MSDTSLDIIRGHMKILQQPLQLAEEPFAGYAESLGISQDETIELLKHYLSKGIIRRVAGVLKHRNAGFRVNAMVVMVIAPDRCDAVGSELALLPFITHCYRRTAYPDWPYTMYAMVHARSEGEFEEHLADIRSVVGDVGLAILGSLKEYKKTAFRIG
jgi:siroheme decarboxylase